VNSVRGPLPFPVALSVFLRDHDRDARRAVIARPAEGLEPDQRRGALPVVVADMDAEAQLAGGVALPAEAGTGADPVSGGADGDKEGRPSRPGMRQDRRARQAAVWLHAGPFADGRLRRVQGQAVYC
jgi:hypothetical protein